jgi:hypothetical protein
MSSNKTPDIDLSDVGKLVEDEINNISTNITYTKIGIFGIRRMLEPLQTIFILVLIIFLSYYCDCKYKNLTKFISIISILILIPFITLVYIYNPWEQYTSPLSIIIKKIDELGLPIDTIINFIHKSVNNTSATVNQYTPKKGEIVI